MLAARFEKLWIQCAQVPERIATGPFIRRAQAIGLQVHVWTVNKTAAMTSLLDLGADGIMTDQTEALRDILIARGQWVSSEPEARQGRLD